MTAAPNPASFSDLISSAVAERMTQEYVETQVLARVDKLITEAVDSALRSYSDTGALIKKAVSDALKVNQLDLPSYGEVVASILKTQIEAKVADLVSGRLAKDMDELLSLAPKEVKLSDIVKELVEEANPDNTGYGEIVTCIVESGNLSGWIYLDDQPDTSKHSCKYRFLVLENGTIASATIDGSNIKTSKHIGRSYGLEQKIRAYVACGTVIIVDEDDVSVSVGDY